MDTKDTKSKLKGLILKSDFSSQCNIMTPQNTEYNLTVRSPTTSTYETFKFKNFDKSQMEKVKGFPLKINEKLKQEKIVLSKQLSKSDIKLDNFDDKYITKNLKIQKNTILKKTINFEKNKFTNEILWDTPIHSIHHGRNLNNINNINNKINIPLIHMSEGTTRLPVLNTFRNNVCNTTNNILKNYISSNNNEIQISKSYFNLNKQPILKPKIIFDEKTLNYKTGSKYLTKNGIDKLYITSNKIKQIISNISLNHLNETATNHLSTEPERCETEINSYEMKHSDTNFRYKVNKTIEDVLINKSKSNKDIPEDFQQNLIGDNKKNLINLKMLNSRKKKEKDKNIVHLYNPTMGMNFLRRTIELRMDEPYFFVNKFGKGNAIDQKNVLVNIFNKNKTNFETSLGKNK